MPTKGVRRKLMSVLSTVLIFQTLGGMGGMGAWAEEMKTRKSFRREWNINKF
jgi:hypothetical protein